ncbi:hypothetical protein [Yoonia sp. SS1-5]|uniref:Uncharacterized protein n=1 Tax=Yoonia rhodophyticola TaxID=3137370 RepID=A0AAN0MCX5_9RHOB
MFWIRIERPILSVVRVTDLNFGSQDIYDVAMLFSGALDQLAAALPAKLVFAALGDPDARQTAVRVRDIEKMVGAMLVRRPLFITGNTLSVHRGKAVLHLDISGVGAANR